MENPTIIDGTLSPIQASSQDRVSSARYRRLTARYPLRTFGSPKFPILVTTSPSFPYEPPLPFYFLAPRFPRPIHATQSMDRAAVGPPDQAAREHRRTLAATLSNRHQRLEPLRQALQETIRIFSNEGTVGAAEAIWASLGENWNLEKKEVNRDVLRFIELARTEAVDRGERSTMNPLVSLIS